eukprot:scaffold222558_cov41-Attheya_sp.AAC.1
MTSVIRARAFPITRYIINNGRPLSETRFSETDPGYRFSETVTASTHVPFLRNGTLEGSAYVACTRGYDTVRTVSSLHHII